MIAAIRRFLDDVHRIADCVAANRMQETLIRFRQEDLDLLNTPRRRRSKKGDAN